MLNKKNATFIIIIIIIFFFFALKVNLAFIPFLFALFIILIFFLSIIFIERDYFMFMMMNTKYLNKLQRIKQNIKVSLGTQK